MNVLAVDASYAHSSVALLCDGREWHARCTDKRAHADALLPLITQLLSDAGVDMGTIDGLAFGRGPGSFTGLRVAAALVQGLAYALNKPVAGISTLAAAARTLVAEGDVLVCNDARKEQVYCGVFHADERGLPELIGKEQVLSPADIKNVQTAIGTGDGFDVYPQLHTLVDRIVASERVAAIDVAHLAAAGWAPMRTAFEAVPSYVRDKVTHGA